MFTDKTREHELRTDDSPHSNGRCEINCFVAQLDMVAKIRNVITHAARFMSFPWIGPENELSGSDATDILKCGMVKNE